MELRRGAAPAVLAALALLAEVAGGCAAHGRGERVAALEAAGLPGQQGDGQLRFLFADLGA
jgi:hypothetical protein